MGSSGVPWRLCEFGVVGLCATGFCPGWPGFSRAVGVESRAATTVESPSEGRFFLEYFTSECHLVFSVVVSILRLSGWGAKGFSRKPGLPSRK